MKKVMILAECGSEVRQQLAERFGGKCELIFPEGKSVSEELLQRMDAVSRSGKKFLRCRLCGGFRLPGPEQISICA